MKKLIIIISIITLLFSCSLGGTDNIKGTGSIIEITDTEKKDVEDILKLLEENAE